MKNISNSIYFLLIFFVMIDSCYGQLTTKFIEPNISITYDQSLFEITNRYSNAHYKTENYDFKLKSKNEVKIHVKANHPSEEVTSFETKDSLMTARIKEVKSLLKKENITILEMDEKVKRIDDFACMGFKIYDNSNKTTATAITCNHVSEYDNTEITLYTSNTVTLAENYEVIKTFLKGFKYYTKGEILIEENKIKNEAEITVEKSNEKIEHLSIRTNAYIGVVKVNESIMSKLKEVRIIKSSAREIFTPEKNGNVYFACAKNNTTETKGEVVFLNSFGKEVIIPFTFNQ